MYLPTPLGFSCEKLSEQLSSHGTKVYVTFQPTRFIPPACCQTGPCALTAHFHPYPDAASGPGRLFSATLSVFPSGRNQKKIPSVRWCSALRCPDFPHSRDKPGTAIEQFAVLFFLSNRKQDRTKEFKKRPEKEKFDLCEKYYMDI